MSERVLVSHEKSALIEFEIAASGEIQTKVAAFFEGADHTIKGGTPQQVGAYTVSINEEPLRGGSSQTTFRAVSNDLPLATHYILKNGSGFPVTNIYTLNGAVENNPVTISTSIHKDLVSVSVSDPNPHLIPGGIPKGTNIKSLGAGYKAKVAKAFGLKI